MILVLSGEGPTDLGSVYAGVFSPGPVALMIDSWLHGRICYSLLNTDSACYVCKTTLAQIAKSSLRSPLRGKKADRNGLGYETRYFFLNSRALVRWIRNENLSQPAIAVLFRDADGTASSGRGEWIVKANSIKHGFDCEEYPYGIAAIANPKSEAWLLCALKNCYINCPAIESSASGNDCSPNSLKRQLEDVLANSFKSFPSRDVLIQMVIDGLIDIHKINMPSLECVKAQCDHVLDLIGGIKARERPS